MRIAALLVLALAAAGCNQVFGLEPAGGDGDGGSSGDGGGGDDGPRIDAPPDDMDADGVLDAVDNCPTVANPRQADEDGDGEINGGDACDLCPHRAGIPAGAPHLDTDGDGLGDECDPDNSVWHCLRWFDGFDDASNNVVLERYTRLGGTWNLQGGALVQNDALAANAELVIGDTTFSAPLIATQGVMIALPVTGPAGMEPYRNAGGVMLANAPGAQACFASVTRGVTSAMAGGASAMLSSRTAAAEIVSATMFIGNGSVPMTSGERFGATLDITATPFYAVAALLDRDATQTVSAVVTCPTGGGGVRTSFASMRFDYLVVVERGTVGVPCPTRLPSAGP